MNELVIVAALIWIGVAIWRLGAVIQRQVQQQMQSVPVISSVFFVNDQVLNKLDLEVTFEGEYVGIVIQNGVDAARPEILDAYLSDGEVVLRPFRGLLEAKRVEEAEWSIHRFQPNNLLHPWTKKTGSAILFAVQDIGHILTSYLYFDSPVSKFGRHWKLYVSLSDREEPYVLAIRHLFTETVLEDEISKGNEDKIKDE